MKNYLILPLAALLLFVCAPSIHANTPTEDETLSLTVEAVKGNAKQANKVKKHLAKIDGVSEVTTCTKSGTVNVSFDKAAMGSSDKLYKAMDAKGWAYTKAGSATKKSCTKPCAKPCGTSKATPNS